MVARNIFFLILILLVNGAIVWCEPSSQKEGEMVAEEKKNSNVNSAEDPYKDVTWDSVSKDQKNQTTDTTVFHQKTKDADFYSVSSTGAAANTETAVVLPVDRRR